MKKLILLSFVSIITLSCGMPSKSDLNFSNSGSQQSLDPDMVVNYSVIKSEVLAPKCLSCHSNVATENGLKAWVTPGKPDSSAFFTLSENGSMPKNGTPLSTRELELIKMYIIQLAAPTPTPTPTPTGITFAKIKTQVLDPYRCTSCHSVSTEAGLAKWLNKTSPASSKFYTSTKDGSMPQGGSRVSAADQAFILQYIKDYAAR